MFAHARRRLTAAYIAMFAIALVTFSLAFLALIAVILEPDFDLAPDTSSDQAAQIAYDAAVERSGIALIVADAVAIGIVGLGAWLLAARTLRPIRDAHERQRRFVADASHEMRTPLTAIRATTENAMRTDATEKDRRAALETASVASAELTTLTTDLLTLAQSGDAGVLFAKGRFDLSVAVAERLELRAAAGSAAPAQTRLAADAVIDGSSDDIGRILDNLVDNAFRHGGQDVHVRVETRIADRQAVLEVADDGPGIALVDQAHIFDAFYRVRSDALAPSGTGLGLAIASALAKRNRGRLTVTSEPERGSVFKVTLPLAG